MALRNLTLIATQSLLFYAFTAHADSGGAYSEPAIGTASTEVGRDDYGRAAPAGGYATSIRIEAPEYYALAPSITLEYQSGAGNHLLGQGWRIAGLPKIERRAPGNGVPSFESDDIYYLDGEPLVECDTRLAPRTASPGCDARGDTSYRYFVTQIESFQRIGFNGSQWRIWNKSGIVIDLNQTLTTRTGKPVAWLISSASDLVGHQVIYTYTADAAPGTVDKELRYPDQIKYNHHTVTFDWESRPDQLSAAMGDGTMSWQRKRLRAIDVQTADGGRRIRAYQLQYKPL